VLLAVGIIILMTCSTPLYSIIGVGSDKSSEVISISFDRPEDSLTESRYGNVIIEDFNNMTYVNRENSSCLVDTFNGRAVLSGNSHNTMKFNYDASVNGGCGDRSSWFTFNFGLMTWDEAEEMANMYGAQFMGAPNFDSYGYNAPYEQLERWVGDRDSNTAYTSTNGWSSVNTRNKNERHYCVLAYANGDTPGLGQFSDSRVVNGKLYYYKDYGTISEKVAYTYCRENGARPLNPYLFGINTRAHMVENHPCHGSVQYNGAGTSADGSSNHNYRGFIGYHVTVSSSTLGHIQSNPLYLKRPTIGAARITWFEHSPQGTNIVYNMTVDGVNWVTMQNGTNHVFQHRGSRLMWNATFTTNDEDVQPYIEKVIIEYDLVSDPEPSAPSSGVWQGTRTPALEWNFTDPDKNDKQSEYLVEIFDDIELNNQIYNTSWVNSSIPPLSEHTVTDELEDGIYFWRVRTRDAYHASSNYSVAKKLKIDVTKPVGNITIEDGVLSVNEQLVDIRINASDNGSGMADMQIIGDRGNVGPWEEFKTEKRIAITPTDGLKMIQVRFRDHAGIVSKDFNDTIYFDLKGPFEVEIISPTHPDPLVHYNSTLPVFSWEPPYEVTGIKGYSYTVDSTPLTEPTKVLYSPNGELTGTYAGEFAGLGEGSWYFHITPCDVYDQWGNTTHFKFSIDSVLPVASDLIPSGSDWFGATSVRTEVTFSDSEGYGLDTESIAYSYRKSGESSLSGWTSDGMEFEILEEGGEGYPAKVRAWTELVFSEGDRNAVMWRVSDMSGNGPVNSEKRAVKVDLSPVTFSDPIPEDEISTETTVSVGISIDDTGGSGVDGKTVEYSISKYGGDDDKYFANWTLINNNMVKESLSILLDIEFEPGRENYIKWRAKDAVGNGYAMSEASQVWINSPPELVIDAPNDDETFVEGSSIRLSAEGTTDNEEEELGFYWLIKGKTSKKTVFKGHDMETLAILDQAGKYMVYLYVDDGYGFNESVKLEIEITPKPTGKEAEEQWDDTTDSDVDGIPDWWEKKNGLDPNDPADATEEMKKSYDAEVKEQKAQGTSEKGLLSRYWWVFIVIGVIILALVILIIVVNRRKKDENAAETTPSSQFPPEYPYPVGDRDFHHPMYTPGFLPQQSPGQYQTGGNVYGQGTMAPPYGSQTAVPGGFSQGQGSAQGMPMLPMQSQTFTDQTGPNAWPADPSMAGIAGLPYQQATGLQAPSAQPDYSLPIMTTDDGVQNLNLMALPPAPSSPDIFSQVLPAVPLMDTGLPDSPAAAIPGIVGPPAFEEGTMNFQGDPMGSAPVAPPLPPQVPPMTPPPSGEPTPPAQSIQCHICSAMNPVNTPERPTIVTCSSCGAQGYLAE
jgi:hypothetical protein